ncbi:effector-binding domain-containing protein [Mariprofundus ferrinatatus]|uniref:Effector-binding domain-containing protein n=1 Tax=Mariprofundus ferrinatatus TaxID=1921087 RepID=A0A2K8L2M2_9PROT|nr:GyrI-like domain-containing protein [Mariprofundus ferrinatatus]ATX81575.1 effector-binding domain-containing protein [Mariprofundus ferrinatatus]
MAADNQERPVTSKMLILILIGLALTLGGGAVVMLYLGAFKDPEVYRSVTKEYHLAYINHKGSYAKIDPILEEVAKHLKESNVEPLTAAALYMDSVSEVAEENRQSKIGYLIRPSDYIPAPLEQMTIQSREVVVARFEGGTLLGSHKAYTGMRDWARANGYQLSLPAFEIYHPDGNVEYQLPIHKKQY